MALFFLINTVTTARGRTYAGTQIDDAADDVASLTAAGAVLAPAGNPTVAAAADIAQARRKQGATSGVVDPIMLAAFNNASRGTRRTVSVDPPSVAANTTGTVDVAVAEAAVGQLVSVTPSAALTAGLSIAYAFVVSAGMVRIAFSNTTAAPIDEAAQDMFIEVGAGFAAA